MPDWVTSLQKAKVLAESREQQKESAEHPCPAVLERSSSPASTKTAPSPGALLPPLAALPNVALPWSKTGGRSASPHPAPQSAHATKNIVRQEQSIPGIAARAVPLTTRTSHTLRGQLRSPPRSFAGAFSLRVGRPCLSFVAAIALVACGGKVAADPVDAGAGLVCAATNEAPPAKTIYDCTPSSSDAGGCTGGPPILCGTPWPPNPDLDKNFPEACLAMTPCCTTHGPAGCACREKKWTCGL